MHRLAGVLLCAVVCSLPLRANAAETSSLTIAWDSSVSADVAGYIVYVGTQSGKYTEQFDVGATTLFDYFSDKTGQTYFFVVRAYNGASALSDPSNEVSAVLGTSGGNSGSSPTPPPATGSSPTAPSPGRQRWPDPGTPPPAQPIPVGTRTAASAARTTVRSLTNAGDEGVLFIDSSTQIRALRDGAIGPESLLAVPSDVRLAGLALDAQFQRTRLAFVAEVSDRPGGTPELTIARYRLVADQFAERATIVQGITLPRGIDPVFDVDNSGHLYVAIPAPPSASSEPADPYAGMVLRFNTDGSVPRDNRAASPVVAHGYATPTDLRVESDARVWLSGSGAAWPAPLAVLDTNTESDQWPKMPHAIDVAVPVPADGISKIAIVRGATAADESRLIVASGAQVGSVHVRAGVLDGVTFWSMAEQGTPIDLLSLSRDAGLIALTPKSSSPDHSARIIPFQLRSDSR